MEKLKSLKGVKIGDTVYIKKDETYIPIKVKAKVEKSLITYIVTADATALLLKDGLYTSTKTF